MSLKNSVNGFDFSPGVRSIEAELSSEPYLRLKTGDTAQRDWLGSTVRLSLKELEQERLQKLERELIGRLIEQYERVVEDGLPPHRAIASILEWTSRECPRLLP